MFFNWPFIPILSRSRLLIQKPQSCSVQERQSCLIQERLPWDRGRPARFYQLILQTLILIICTSLFSACGKAHDEESKPDGEPAKQSSNSAPVEVVAYTVTKESIPLYKEWVGQTEANQTVNIRARVDGNLESASFKEGDFVNKGQVLFQIEKDTYLATLQSAKADLSKAEAKLSQSKQQVQLKEENALLAKYQSALTKAEQDLVRTKSLAQQGAISQHELDAAADAQRQALAQVESQKAKLADTGLNKVSSIEQDQASVESAKAAVKQAQLNLDYTTIRSPLRGLIGRISVDPGNLVSKADGAVLATISELDPIKVVFNASEAEYLKYAKADKNNNGAGVPLELYLADNSLYPYKGHFSLVDRAVDPKTGTISCEVVFQNPKALLRPGQYGRVRTVAQVLKDAITIPDKCVQDVQGNKTVFVVGADNKVTQRTIKVLETVKEKVIVESGLSAGEKIILEGLLKVHPGDKVILVSEKSR